MTYDDLMTTAGGVPLILEDLRARALAGGGGTPAPRAAIGSNLKGQGVAVLADIFQSGVTWQNEQQFQEPNNGFGPAPSNANAGSTYRLTISPPFADGEFHVMRWREPGNSTSTSRWSRNYTNFYLEYSGTRFESVQESYANGIFTSRFRFFKRTDGRNPAAVIRWSGSGSIELLDFRPEALPATEYFNPDVIAVSSQRRGNIRALDLGGGNVWRQDWLWSERSRLDYEANKASRQPSMPLELWRDLAIRTNRDLEWIITHKLPKSTIQAMVRAFMTGEGFDDGKPLPAHLNLYLELCDNEPWNSDLTGAYQDLSAIGFATGYTGSDGNFARLYAQEKRGRDVSAWIAEAVPTYMDRIVRIIGLSPANDLNDYISLTGNDKSYFDAVSKSIYMGIFAKSNYGGNTPAEIAPAWSADATAQVDAFLNNLSTYRADGKRTLCYEVGSDTGAVPWTNQQRADWLNSSEFRAIYKRELSRAASAMRDRLNLYWDFGPVLDDARVGAWGHYPGQKWTVANEVQAQLDAVTD